MAIFPSNINAEFNASSNMIPLVKILVFFFLWGLFWLPLAIPLGKYLNWSPWQPFTDQQKLPMVASLYLLAPGILIIVSGGQESSFGDYGLHWHSSLFLSLLVGISFGIVGLTVVFIFQSWLGWIQWNLQNIKQFILNMIPLLGLALWIGGTEELIFRGFLLTELSKNYPGLGAAFISSLIFAALHLIWERQKTLPQLPGLILMGLVLVLARQIDHGSLGLAWGLHGGWIFSLGSLDSAQMLHYTGKGNPWTLGQYQEPLANLLGILCLLGTGICLWTLPQINQFFF